MSEQTKAVYEAEIWLKAWCAAVRGGRMSWKASKYADGCVKEIKERFCKEEEGE